MSRVDWRRDSGSDFYAENLRYRKAGGKSPKNVDAQDVQTRVNSLLPNLKQRDPNVLRKTIALLMQEVDKIPNVVGDAIASALGELNTSPSDPVRKAAKSALYELRELRVDSAEQKLTLFAET